jgi:ABC-type transport system involved in multi-copper enzyme maturation permease subunit
MIVNPVIQRELLSTFRQRRVLAAMVGLAAALSLAVVLLWPASAVANLSGQQARQVFAVFGYGLLAGLMLLAPAFPAVNLVRERQQGTLALLLNSPMSPAAILTGKIIASMGLVLTLVLVSLPPAAACYAMGGIGLTDQFAAAYLVLVLMGLQYVVLALWISSYAASTDAALRLTYGLILLLGVLAMGPYQLLSGMSKLDLLPGGAVSLPISGPVRTILEWLRSLSPIPAIMQAMQQSGPGADGTQSGVNWVARYVVLALGSIAVFAGWTVSRLNLRLFDRPRASAQATDDRSSAQRWYRGIMFLYFFDPQRRSGLIGPLTNPVMVKEFRTRRFGRSNWMMRLVMGCAVASLGLAYLSTLMIGGSYQQFESASMVGAIIVLLQVALIVLTTPSLAAGLISGEVESGGWQLLQMTPLRPLTIVTGKILSVAWTLVLILLATLPGYGVLLLIDPSRRGSVIDVLITLALTALLALLLSAAVSSCLRRTAAATATAYALLLALCAGPILVWLGAGRMFEHGLVQQALRLDPLATALSLIDAPGFADYQLKPQNWWFMAGASALCLVVLWVRTRALTRPR